RVLGLLDDCAREIRGLVAVAADPEASHDARLATACRRVQAAVEALTDGRDIAVRTAPAADEPVLAHLHGLERALAELAAPLRAPSGSPLVGA
ncbi:FUSC family protein, partial [Streptomyces sp. G35A]